IVVAVSLALTILVALAFRRFLSSLFDQLPAPTALSVANLWIPPVLFAFVAFFGLTLLFLPAWRGRVRWRLPAFREASLAQLAAALALMLRSGVTLTEALALSESLEAGTSTGKALAQWRSMVESG